MTFIPAARCAPQELLDNQFSHITVVQLGQPPESYFQARLGIRDKCDSGGCPLRLFSRKVCL